MVDKSRVRYKLKNLQRVKTWHLVVLLIFSAFLSATFLRLNNIGMIERRNAVAVADERGDDKIIQNRLYDLQRYVSAHMNADMGRGIYLEFSYNRDIKKAYDTVSSSSNPNGNIYKKAQQICEPKFTNYSYEYLQCTTSELAKYPSSDALIDSVKLPRADSYLHVFISPTWSSDFAGWSLLVFGAILLLIISRITAVIILRILLRHHYKSI